MSYELIFAAILAAGVVLLLVVFLRGRSDRQQNTDLQAGLDAGYDPVDDLVGEVRIIPADEFHAKNNEGDQEVETAAEPDQADMFAEPSAADAISAVEEEPAPVVVGALPDDKPRPDTEKVVIFHISRRSGEMINGTHIRRAAIAAGLVLDADGFFTRRNSNSQMVFRVANMVKPGTFDAAHFEAINTPGITLFLAIPDLFPIVPAFDDMLNTAGDLAERLEAVVLDQNRVLLNEQSARHERDAVIALAKDFAARS